MTRTASPHSQSLHEFSAKVGCHFTTASRLRAGTRIPGREMFDRIIKAYNLDPMEALKAYVGPRAEFGAYLREEVFHITEEELLADKARNGK